MHLPQTSSYLYTTSICTSIRPLHTYTALQFWRLLVHFQLIWALLLHPLCAVEGQRRSTSGMKEVQNECTLRRSSRSSREAPLRAALTVHCPPTWDITLIARLQQVRACIVMNSLPFPTVLLCDYTKAVG